MEGKSRKPPARCELISSGTREYLELLMAPIVRPVRRRQSWMLVISALGSEEVLKCGGSGGGSGSPLNYLPRMKTKKVKGQFFHMYDIVSHFQKWSGRDLFIICTRALIIWLQDIYIANPRNISSSAFTNSLNCSIKKKVLFTEKHNLHIFYVSAQAPPKKTIKIYLAPSRRYAEVS